MRIIKMLKNVSSLVREWCTGEVVSVRILFPESLDSNPARILSNLSIPVD